MFPYPPIWILTHSDLRRVARISLFMSFVADAFSSLRRTFEGSGR